MVYSNIYNKKNINYIGYKTILYLNSLNVLYKKGHLINKKLVCIVVIKMDRGISIGERQQNPRLSQHIFSSCHCREE